MDGHQGQCTGKEWWWSIITCCIWRQVAHTTKASREIYYLPYCTTYSVSHREHFYS